MDMVDFAIADDMHFCFSLDLVVVDGRYIYRDPSYSNPGIQIY